VKTLKELALPDDVPPATRAELQALLARAPGQRPPLDELWQLMDDVWDGLGLDNRQPDPELLGKFYRHPIWTLNGLYTEQDPESIAHRNAVADWLAARVAGRALRVIDVGGGFGMLAQLVSARGMSVHVLEPYPTELGKARLARVANAKFITTPQDPYDALIAMDVLEHVPDPAATLVEMIRWVRPGGLLLFQNHFAPSIKCHLPATFHLNESFGQLARLCGLSPMGRIAGSYTDAWQKSRTCQPSRLTLAAFDVWSRCHSRTWRAARAVVRGLRGARR
jgi:SAM-dependent methyltransferase